MACRVSFTPLAIFRHSAIASAAYCTSQGCWIGCATRPEIAEQHSRRSLQQTDSWRPFGTQSESEVYRDVADLVVAHRGVSVARLGVTGVLLQASSLALARLVGTM